MEGNVIEFKKMGSVFITQDFANDYRKNHRKLTDKELNKVKEFVSFIGQNKNFPGNTKLVSIEKKEDHFKVQMTFGVFAFISKKKGMFYLTSMELM